jgi:hypothetical protein
MTTERPTIAEALASSDAFRHLTGDAPALPLEHRYPVLAVRKRAETVPYAGPECCRVFTCNDHRTRSDGPPASEWLDLDAVDAILDAIARLDEGLTAARTYYAGPRLTAAQDRRHDEGTAGALEQDATGPVIHGDQGDASAPVPGPTPPPVRVSAPCRTPGALGRHPVDPGTGSCSCGTVRRVLR